MSSTGTLSFLKNKHKGKYRYLNLDDNTKVTDNIQILCPIHGPFTQKLRKHKEGQGCPDCNKYKKDKK